VTELPCISAWRRLSLKGLQSAGIEQARQSLLEAQRRLGPVVMRHTLLTMVAQACCEHVAGMCVRAEVPGLELKLMTSRSGTDESRILFDLWEVAHDQMTIAEFLSEHGYHGPNGGCLESYVCRDEPAAVEDLARQYRGLLPEAHPKHAARQRIESAEDARRRLLRAIPSVRRPFASALLRLATEMPALRELGKSTFLQIVDVGRAAARTIGTVLTDQGALADMSDVFFLTVSEACEVREADLRALIERRRSDDSYFRTRQHAHAISLAPRGVLSALLFHRMLKALIPNTLR